MAKKESKPTCFVTLVFNNQASAESFRRLQRDMKTLGFQEVEKDGSLAFPDVTKWFNELWGEGAVDTLHYKLEGGEMKTSAVQTALMNTRDSNECALGLTLCWSDTSGTITEVRSFLKKEERAELARARNAFVRRLCS